MKGLDLNITVVGLGLIGGSLALALRELSPNSLWAVDINEEVLMEAKEVGAIDQGYLDPKIPLSKSDLVIVAVYPKIAFKFLQENMKYIKTGAIVTDTVGVKINVMNEMKKLSEGRVDFIGGHPMAGREIGSFKNATKDLFKDTSYIFTPAEDSDATNVETLVDIAKKIGCKDVISVSAEKHDEIIAYTSQLPHVIAAALVDNEILNESKFFVGGSFKGATRVANINEELWSQLLILNKENIFNQIEAFENSINRVKLIIEKGDKDELKKYFKEVKERKEDVFK